MAPSWTLNFSSLNGAAPESFQINIFSNDFRLPLLEAPPSPYLIQQARPWKSTQTILLLIWQIGGKPVGSAVSAPGGGAVAPLQRLPVQVASPVKRKLGYGVLRSASPRLPPSPWSRHGKGGRA